MDKEKLAAFEKIEKIIKKTSEYSPEKKFKDPFKILKRFEGIMKNYTEENAERKLSNIINMVYGKKIKGN